jgi:hypothetical protein
MNEEYRPLSNAIHTGDKETGIKEALVLVSLGKKVPQIFIECIEPTLVDVGERFSRLDILPQPLKRYRRPCYHTWKVTSCKPKRAEL